MKIKTIKFNTYKENQNWCDLMTSSGNFVLADSGIVVHNSHIASLVITALLKVIPGLFEHQKIYRALMPLYGVKKYEGKFLPFYNEDDMKSFKEKNPKIQITRYKGLGEMDPPELEACLLDPTIRKLQPISKCDIKEAEEIFKMMSDAETKRGMLDDGSEN